jgi:serine/threonine protein kinase
MFNCGTALASSQCSSVSWLNTASRALQASGPGTVSYAAPEALSNNQVSPATDMFSFGCVLWELLSMKEPWAELGGQAFQIMSKIIYEKKSLRAADIPDEVRSIVPKVMAVLEQCFSFDPTGRPTAEAAYDVLDDALEHL